MHHNARVQKLLAATNPTVPFLRSVHGLYKVSGRETSIIFEAMETLQTNPALRWWLVADPWRSRTRSAVHQCHLCANRIVADPFISVCGAIAAGGLAGMEWARWNYVWPQQEKAPSIDQMTVRHHRIEDPRERLSPKSRELVRCATGICDKAHQQHAFPRKGTGRL